MHISSKDEIDTLRAALSFAIRKHTSSCSCQACEVHWGNRRQGVQCEWCEVPATITVTWECGHASAMCQGCFDPPDPWGDDPHSAGLDILDWGSDGYPMICPNCAG